MITLKEFMNKSGAELVAGNLIVGSLEDRRIVGDVRDGTFFLNEEGQKILTALEAGDPEPVKPKAPKRKPTDNAGKTREDFLAELGDLDIE
jgi:hypothetical protein